MTYKEQHPKLPTKTHFSTFTEKDYSYISYIYTIKCKEPIHFKPKSGKTLHFPIKNYLNLHFELEDNTKFYSSIPYTYFLQKFKDVFHFLDMIINDENNELLKSVVVVSLRCFITDIRSLRFEQRSHLISSLFG